MLRNVSVNCTNGISCNKAEIHSFLLALKKEMGFSIEYLPINLVDSETIHKVNVEYLDHDYSTDIITFNYSGNNSNLDGEIFISVNDAYENSQKFGVSLHEEILRLIIHGILHLLGHDDKTDIERKKQKKIEDSLVTRYSNLANNINTRYD